MRYACMILDVAFIANLIPYQTLYIGGRQDPNCLQLSPPQNWGARQQSILTF